jgi:hypothetical protein
MFVSCPSTEQRGRLQFALHCLKWRGMLSSVRGFKRSISVCGVVCAVVGLLLSGCSDGKVDVPSNTVKEYVPPSSEVAAETVAIAPSTVAATSTISPTTVVVISTTAAPTEISAAAFVPPSTTIPDDPNFQEAIRNRVAVEAEYIRQERAGTADAAGFAGLADPQTWLPLAVEELARLRDLGIVTRPQTISGISVYSAKYQQDDQIVLELCIYDDDSETATQLTVDPADDSVVSGLNLYRFVSVMKRKGGKWLYQGSIDLQQSC